jgi:hypothetical protein
MASQSYPGSAEFVACQTISGIDRVLGWHHLEWQRLVAELKRNALTGIFGRKVLGCPQVEAVEKCAVCVPNQRTDFAQIAMIGGSGVLRDASVMPCNVFRMSGEVVDAVGIEPTTSRLRVECSTN